MQIHSKLELNVGLAAVNDPGADLGRLRAVYTLRQWTNRSRGRLLRGCSGPTQKGSGWGRPVLKMRSFDNLTQDRTIPMTEQAINPLRRRMIEDMSIRKFAEKTQHDYVERVKHFATFLGRSPDRAKSEDVRRFRLHLTSSRAGTPKINATVSALRFFFNVTLDRPDLTKHLSFIHEPGTSCLAGTTRQAPIQQTVARSHLIGRRDRYRWTVPPSV